MQVITTRSSSAEKRERCVPHATIIFVSSYFFVLAVAVDEIVSQANTDQIIPVARTSSMAGAVQKEGKTIVPLKLYFNDKGRAKLELALARGKKLHDKRETEKKRDWQREKSRLMKNLG